MYNVHVEYIYTPTPQPPMCMPININVQSIKWQYAHRTIIIHTTFCCYCVCVCVCVDKEGARYNVWIGHTAVQCGGGCVLGERGSQHPCCQQDGDTPSLSPATRRGSASHQLCNHPHQVSSPSSLAARYMYMYIYMTPEGRCATPC